MRRLFVIAAVVAACSSSGSGGAAEPAAPAVEVTPAPAWPDGWDTDFCYAIDQLTDANGHLQASADDGQSYDLDGAASEAEQAATDAKDAIDALDAAADWAPAHSATVYLRSAADEMRKAANLIKVGVENIDVATVQEAIKHQEKATYQLGRAADASTGFAAKYGHPC